MALSTISGTTGITDATITSAKLADFAAAVDLNGVELILDADQDTSITADTDDRIDFKIAGVEHISISNSSGDTVIKPMVDAKDILFQQYDGRTLLDINDGGFIGIANGATGAGAIRIFEDTDNGSNYVGLSVGNVSTAYTLVFPNADGSSGQALTTNGSGVLSFTTLSANTPSSADGQALGSASLEWSDLFLADASTIQFGNDQDVVLTHVADTGLLLSGTNVIQFNDASQNIGAPSATVLDINATDEIELNATLVDVNANLDVSGTYTGGGLMTTGGNIVIPDAGNIGSASDTDAIAIASNGVTTFSQAPVLSGASISAGTIPATALDIDGATDIGAAIVDADLFIVDDGAGGTNRKTTAARLKTYIGGNTPSSADGQALGSASLEWSDLFLADGGQVLFGNDQEITLTHDADVGLKLKHTATADDKPIVLTLQTGETDMAANDVMGAIRFQAPDEGTGTDAILVAAAIQAVSEGDFSSSSNATRLEFHTGASEAASSKMTLTSGGILNVTELHGGATNDAGGTVSISSGDSGASANSSASQLVVENNGAAGMSILSFNNNDGNIFFGDGQDDDIGRITYNHTNNRMDFYSNAAERLRITSSGELGVNEGQIDTGGIILKVSGASNNTVVRLIHKNTGSTTETLMDFRDGDITQCGTINIAPGSNTVSYNTSSDYRLKENESDISDGITRVKQLKPYRFNWIKDATNTKVDGFFAHEVSSIVPESINGEKDEMEKYRENQTRPEDKNVGDFVLDESGNQIPKYQQIDQAKLVPLLTAALKESITKIEALEARVTTLEG